MYLKWNFNFKKKTCFLKMYFKSWRNWVQRVSGRVLLPVSLWSVHWLPSNGSSTTVSRLPFTCHVHHHHRCQNHSERSSKHNSNRDIPLNLFISSFNQSNVNKFSKSTSLLGYIDHGKNRGQLWHFGSEVRFILNSILWFYTTGTHP